MLRCFESTAHIVQGVAVRLMIHDTTLCFVNSRSSPPLADNADKLQTSRPSPVLSIVEDQTSIHCSRV
jgi:hypothetical protein